MPEVNPKILRRARETACLSIEEAAAKLGIDAARGVPGRESLARLEAGETEPTRPLLVKMAKQYRRPLLTFYLPEWPRTGERGEDFRTLPPEHSRRDGALIDALIRASGRARAWCGRCSKRKTKLRCWGQWLCATALTLSSRPW
jgi:transcriptional regulator with XRE-family HTH domain